MKNELMAKIIKKMNFNNPSSPSNEKNQESDSIPSENEIQSGEDLKKTSKYNSGRWTQEEHLKFIDGILEYGNEWKKVQSLIKTRSSTQARSHAQKFFLRIKKNLNITDIPSTQNENSHHSSSPVSSSQDNFSIKYFFELLASQDKEKSKFENGKLTSSQREKLLSIVAKYSSNEFDNLKNTKQMTYTPILSKNINFNNNNNNNSLEISEEVNSLTSRITNLPGKIFDITKDKSRRESINSMYNIETNKGEGKKTLHKMSYDISLNNKKKQSPINNTNLELISTQSISSFNQDNDNKIYQEMKELFGKKRKSESKIEDFTSCSNFENARPRFNSTNCEINLDSQKLFDNPDFFPIKKMGDKQNILLSKSPNSNPFFINFEIDNEINPFSQTPYFEENENVNNIHTELNFNTLDDEKFNLV